jgi:FkbM family methyltransferase
MKSRLVRLIHGFVKLPIPERCLIWLIQNFPNQTWLIKFAPLNTDYKPNDKRLCTRYGIHYNLYVNDYQQWLLYFYSSLDSSFELLKYINQGETIVDIGSNIGQTTLAIAHKLNNTGKIYSFEPFPSTFSLLENNIKLNRFSNIIPENIGLGEQDASVEMTIVCPTNTGGNRIESKNKDDNNKINVKVTSLDKYFEKLEAHQNIHFIKIDVEGYEMQVLKGSTQILKQKKPKLFIEISDPLLRNQGSSAEQIIRFLQKLGYILYDTTTNKEVFSFTDLSPNCKDIYCKTLYN